MQTTQLMKGWALELVAEGQFEIVNRGPNGERLYFRIVPGPYSPVIEEEPENAQSLGLNSYVDANGAPTSPQMKLVGIICKDQPGPGGKILVRTNLTNFLHRDGGTIDSTCAEIEVKGDKYRLYRLAAANKNRLLGYIGAYLPVDQHDGRPVEILEFENLI